MSEDLKARLLKARLPEGTVDLEGIGTVRVRGLSRGEVFLTQQAKGVELHERKIVTIGMVDPVMTEDEVKQWQRNSPAGEMEAVVEKIRDLSGLGDASAKQANLEFRDDAGPGVRVLPGAEAGDDGGAAPGADEQ